MLEHVRPRPIEDLLGLPGDRLFQYMDENDELKPVTAQSVNRYLKEVVGDKITSKDLRTFGGTVRAATILADIGPASTKTEMPMTVRGRTRWRRRSFSGVSSTKPSWR